MSDHGTALDRAYALVHRLEARTRTSRPRVLKSEYQTGVRDGWNAGLREALDLLHFVIDPDTSVEDFDAATALIERLNSR